MADWTETFQEIYMNGQEFALFDFDLKSNIDIMRNFSSFCIYLDEYSSPL